MRWTVPAAALLLTGLLGLAGCAEEGLEPTAHVGGATETTGVIHGVVVDGAIVPVAGASVSLPDADQDTTTDGDGRFAFLDLEPGTYRVQVNHTDHLPVQVTAIVAAGVDDPPVLTVQLSRVGPDWWLEAHQVAGILEYGSSSSVGGQGLGGISCCSDYFWKHELLRGRPDWVQSEVVWGASLPTAENMRLTHSGGETCVQGVVFSACALDVYHQVDGPSPLVLATPGEDVVIAEEDPFVQASIFAGEVGEEGVAGVGLAVDQQFELFVHVFYGFAPVEGWAFVHDGAHPVPER